MTILGSVSLQLSYLQHCHFKGHTSEGWQLSPTAGWSCDKVCQAVGLKCSEAGQHAHNGDVTSSSGIQSIMDTMGKKCVTYNSEWGTALDVPGIKTNDQCYASSSSRTPFEYSCSNKHAPMYRLCYCSSAGNLWDHHPLRYPSFDVNYLGVGLWCAALIACATPK